MRCKLIFMLCLFVGTVFGQSTSMPYRYKAPVILKLAPLWLLDADPALAGGLEIRTGQRTSIQGEFGYGRPGWGSMNSTGNQHAGTWRIKAEMRFYRNRYRTNRRQKINISTTYPLGNYWALEAYTKLLNVRHSWIYKDLWPNPSVPAVPVDIRETLIRRNSLSLTAKVGRQFGWTDNAHQGTARVLWDAYIGVGLRLTNQNNDGQWATPGYTNSFKGMFNRFSSNGFTVAPVLTAGVKLGFAL